MTDIIIQRSDKGKRAGKKPKGVTLRRVTAAAKRITTAATPILRTRKNGPISGMKVGSWISTE